MEKESDVVLRKPGDIYNKNTQQISKEGEKEIELKLNMHPSIDRDITKHNIKHDMK